MVQLEKEVEYIKVGMLRCHFSFLNFCSISSIDICEGVLLQRVQPGPAEERADAVEELDDAKEGDPEVAGSCPEEKE